MTLVRVVPGGQAAKFGVKENDKIISINNKSPANVDAAVGIIKEAGKSTKLVLVRVEEVPEVVFDGNHSQPNIGDIRVGSRSGSVPSFNTNYGRSRPVVRVFESEISKSYHVRGHRLVLKYLYRSQTKESIV